MDAIASRIIKARLYAAERDQRLWVNNLQAQIHGENADHRVSYNQGSWDCDCEEFQRRSICAHVMTMEEILGEAVQIGRASCRERV